MSLFRVHKKRRKKLCSVDKANVLETTELWRQVFTDVHKNYPDVMLSHMYVDNAAMQLVKEPGQFDVVATGNLFGDILSDLAGALIGSLGLLPSASLNQHRKGLYEPAHGSAPDIAGQDKANPLATLLSLAMLFRYSLQEEQWAQTLEEAIASVLEEGYRIEDGPLRLKVWHLIDRIACGCFLEKVILPFRWQRLLISRIHNLRKAVVFL